MVAASSRRREPVQSPLRPMAPTKTPWNPRFYEASPLHASIAHAAARLGECELFPTHDLLNQRIGPLTAVPEASAAPRRFVHDLSRRRTRAQGERTLESLYDGRIALRGEIATRASDWHDLLNALVWASFPRSKRTLSERQYEIHKARVGERFERLPPTRTPEQDTLALLDEGSVLLVADARLCALLREAVEAQDYDELGARVQNGTLSLLLFGHAQHEHLVRGEREVRAGAVIVGVPGLPRWPEPTVLLDAADRALAAMLGDPACFRERPTAIALLLSMLEGWLQDPLRDTLSRHPDGSGTVTTNGDDPQ